MDELCSGTYLMSVIKKILFLVVFWVGNYFVLTSVYKEKSEWTLEHIWGSIGMTTALAIGLILFIIFYSLGGWLIGIIGTLACLFGLAWLGDIIVEVLKMDKDAAFHIISFIGIFINIVILIKLFLNIRDYRIVRYAEKHGTNK